MKLYEISEQYNAALSDLVDMEVTSEVLADSMAAIAGEFEDKAKAVSAFILNVEEDIETLKRHEQKIAQRRKSLESKIDWLRDYLKSNMVACGISKIESKFFNVSLRKPQKVVSVFDESVIPNEYKKTIISIDKTAIKKALTDGGIVDGATLEDGQYGLVIK
jgi:ribonucleotide monophosphatase NagD (HAD superfamily)